MVIGGRTFQMGLPTSTVSYWLIKSGGLAIVYVEFCRVTWETMKLLTPIARTWP